MFESVVCEHMPETATARNKATNWKRRFVGHKKSYFIKNRGRSEDRKQNFLVWPYRVICTSDLGERKSECCVMDID